MNLDSAVRTATFLRPAERPILTNTLATVLTAYDRPESDAYGLVGAISYAVTNGVVSFRQVAQFIVNVTPLASDQGQPIEPMLAMLAQMTQQGISVATVEAWWRDGLIGMAEATA